MHMNIVETGSEDNFMYNFVFNLTERGCLNVPVVVYGHMFTSS